MAKQSTGWGRLSPTGTKGEPVVGLWTASGSLGLPNWAARLARNNRNIPVSTINEYF